MVDMYLKTVCCLFFVLSFDVSLSANSDTINYKITHRNKCLNSNIVLRYYLKISLSQCVKECAVREECKSVNYRRHKLVCELYWEEDGVFIENNVKTGPCVFVSKSSIQFQRPSSCDCQYLETCDLDTNSCVKKECTMVTLRSLLDGEIKGNLYTIGSKVKKKCPKQFSGEYVTMTCEPTGIWSHLFCRKLCPVLNLDKGVLYTIYSVKRAVGYVVTFTCNDGYFEIENRTYTGCNPTQQWSYMPRCVAANCSTSLSYYRNNYNNVALEKTVIMDDIYGSTTRDMMVDGNHTTFHPYCTHAAQLDTYAIVDLGQTYTIYAVYILNRQECCSHRLRNVSITIGDDVDALQLYVYHQPAIGDNCTFAIGQPCIGRYLKIDNTYLHVLTICELEVYGEP